MLGKHFGRRVLANRLKELGVVLLASDLDLAYRKFCELSDKKKSVGGENLLSLISVEDERPCYAYGVNGPVMEPISVNAS